MAENTEKNKSEEQEEKTISSETLSKNEKRVNATPINVNETTSVNKNGATQKTTGVVNADRKVDANAAKKSEDMSNQAKKENKSLLEQYTNDNRNKNMIYGIVEGQPDFYENSGMKHMSEYTPTINSENTSLPLMVLQTPNGRQEYTVTNGTPTELVNGLPTRDKLNRIIDLAQAGNVQAANYLTRNQSLTPVNIDNKNDLKDYELYDPTTGMTYTQKYFVRNDANGIPQMYAYGSPIAKTDTDLKNQMTLIKELMKSNSSLTNNSANNQIASQRDLLTYLARMLGLDTSVVNAETRANGSTRQPKTQNNILIYSDPNTGIPYVVTQTTNGDGTINYSPITHTSRFDISDIQKANLSTTKQLLKKANYDASPIFDILNRRGYSKVVSGLVDTGTAIANGVFNFRGMTDEATYKRYATPVIAAYMLTGDTGVLSAYGIQQDEMFYKILSELENTLIISPYDFVNSYMFGGQTTISKDDMDKAIYEYANYGGNQNTFPLFATIYKEIEARQNKNKGTGNNNQGQQQQGNNVNNGNNGNNILPQNGQGQNVSDDKEKVKQDARNRIKKNKENK